MLSIGIVLTIGTGLFVASEFALVNLDRAELENRQSRGERGLAPVIGALKITSTHLSSAQLGITLTTLLTGYTLEPALSTWLSPAFAALGIPDAVARPIAVVVAMTGATLLSMIVGELVPKNFALALPRATAKVVVPFQVVFTTVFKPIVSFLNDTANAILRSLGVEPKEELSSARTATELAALVRRSATVGSLDSDTATLLERTLVFSGRTAGDVMTPRPRVESIERAAASRVIELARSTGLSRFPVEGEDIDDLVGIVHVKQALAVPREQRAEVPVSALMSEPLRVPDTMKLDLLIGQLRTRGYQMAAVLDEYGGTAGVVTLEDLVEELIGEVSDEHDRRSAGVVRTKNGIVFPGMLRPDELFARAGVRVPEDEDYETVAGFVLSALGRMPGAGDTVTIEAGTFTVERMDGHRVDRLRFTPAPAEESAAPVATAEVEQRAEEDQR